MRELRLIILFLLALASAAYGQTGSPKSQSQLNAEINGNCPDNTTGLCTPRVYRQDLLDIVASTTPTVATHAALVALATTPGTVQTVIQLDYSTGLGAPPLAYTSSSSPCFINSGFGDGGSQVPALGGGCWVATFSGDLDVRWWGANGTATDSVSIQNAINYASFFGGRRIIFPPLGKAYLINTGLVLGNNFQGAVSLIGSGGMYWPGPYDNTEADWTQKGTWFHCTDLVNPCITIGGPGNTIDYLNFWYTQTTPPSNSGSMPPYVCPGNPCIVTHGWTPTTYPYTIAVLGTTVTFNSGTFNYIRNINIVNATHCLDFESPANGQANFNTYVEHAFMGCFTVGTNFFRIDNTPILHDIHYHVLWFTFSSDVLGWMQGDATHTCNRTDWIMGYVAALHANGIEFFESCAAMFAYNATVTNGVGTLTFAVQSAQLSDITFSQVCQAIILQNATTNFDANLANVVLSIDPSTSNATQCGGVTPVAFGLNSDNVNVKISNLDILDVQTIVNLGGGSPGTIPPYFTADINLVQTYSQYTNGNAAFIAAAGACLDITGTNRIFSQNGSAGPLFSGAGFTAPSSKCLTAKDAFGITGPGTVHSAAGTPLPTCNAGFNGATAIVSDSTAPTYRNAYTSGGAVTSRVLCVNGTGWVNN